MDALHLTAETAEDVHVFAGFWSRAAAKLIDCSLLGLLLLPMDAAFGTSFVVGRTGFGRTPVGEALVFALLCLYSAVMESSARQATFGKRAIGILVTDLDRNRISFRRALLRSALQVTGFGHLLAVLTPRRQALHDVLADTKVLPGSL